MKKWLCAAVALTLLLAGCRGSKLPDSSGASLPDESPPLAAPSITDENLLTMRDDLLSPDACYSCRLPEMDTLAPSQRVRVDETLRAALVEVLLGNGSPTPVSWEDVDKLLYEQLSIQPESISMATAITVDKTDTGDTILDLTIKTDAYSGTPYLYQYQGGGVYDEVKALLEANLIPNSIEVTGADTVDISLQNGDALYTVLECDGLLAGTTWAAGEDTYLEIVDPATGESIFSQRLEGNLGGITACYAEGYDFTIQFEGGVIRCYNIKKPGEPHEFALPQPLVSLLAEAEASTKPWANYHSFDGDAASGISAASDFYSLLVYRGNEEILRLANSEIETDTIEGFDKENAEVGFTQPQVLNGGRHVVASVMMPTGASGQGQNWVAGLLVYDVQTGEKSWVYGIFSGYGADFRYPGGTQIIGIRERTTAIEGGNRQFPEPDYAAPPARLDLATMEIRDDVYHPEPFRYLFGTVDYTQYLFHDTRLLPDGSTESVFSAARAGGEMTPVLTVKGSAAATIMPGSITQNYILAQVNDAGTKRQLLLRYD